MYKNGINRISFLCCLSNIIVIEINFYYYTIECTLISTRLSRLFEKSYTIKAWNILLYSCNLEEIKGLINMVNV